jgi:molecular chaperone GrpE
METINHNEEFQEIPDRSTGAVISPVDDFIRELEAKEKDLQITADWSIEVAEADFDDQNIPDFLRAELDPPAAARPSSGDLGENSSLAEEIQKLKKRVGEFETERAGLLEDNQRRAADFQSYKSRTERERRETFSNHLSNLATEMLPVLDNLDRALDFAAGISEEKRLEFQQFFDGITLVSQQLNEIFAGMGVVPINSVGETFDPHLHEAVAAEPSQFPQNTIISELLRGYRIGDKVIRHSMVKVAAPKPSDAA